MEAMYIKEPGQAEFTDIEEPVRKKGEVLLKLLYEGICGDDLGSYKGIFAYFDYLKIPDHEFSAEIVETDGGSEQGLRPGMIVICNPYFNCGHCCSCRNGIVNTCMDSQAMGCQRDSAFQGYITMPSERVYDRKGIDSMFLAVIGPPRIGHHGVSQAEAGTGEKVLIVGAGTIGVLAAVTAKAKGALVYMSDISEGKLEMAKAFGVDGTVLNNSPEDLEKVVNNITEGNGFDMAVEVVGLPSTFRNCADAACFGDKVVVIGVGKKSLDFNLILLQKRELNVSGSRNTSERDFVELVDLVKSGETPIKNIITNVYKSESKVKAFYDSAHDPGDILEVAMDFTGN